MATFNTRPTFTGSNPLIASSNATNREAPPQTSSYATDYRNYGKNIRSRTIPPGAEYTPQPTTVATFSSTSSRGMDWRVKISLPGVSTFKSSPVLRPLAETGYNLVFPLTPVINIVSAAMYDDVAPIHNNYPFPAYKSSLTQEFTIAGDFAVQNSEDADYWTAAVHFGRSVTKMAYGETSNKGAPPPICKVNGYGPYVLNNLPVVVTSFALDLPNQVDYIAGSNGMAPTLSQLAFTCKPIYSRSKVKGFSLDNFVNGGLAGGGYI